MLWLYVVWALSLVLAYIAGCTVVVFKFPKLMADMTDDELGQMADKVQAIRAERAKDELTK